MSHSNKKHANDSSFAFVTLQDPLQLTQSAPALFAQPDSDPLATAAPSCQGSEAAAVNLLTPATQNLSLHVALHGEDQGTFRGPAVGSSAGLAASTLLKTETDPTPPSSAPVPTPACLKCVIPGLPGISGHAPPAGAAAAAAAAGTKTAAGVQLATPPAEATAVEGNRRSSRLGGINAEKSKDGRGGCVVCKFCASGCDLCRPSAATHCSRQPADPNSGPHPSNFDCLLAAIGLLTGPDRLDDDSSDSGGAELGSGVVAEHRGVCNTAATAHVLQVPPPAAQHPDPAPQQRLTPSELVDPPLQTDVRKTSQPEKHEKEEGKTKRRADQDAGGERSTGPLKKPSAEPPGVTHTQEALATQPGSPTVSHVSHSQIHSGAAGGSASMDATHSPRAPSTQLGEDTGRSGTTASQNLSRLAAEHESSQLALAKSHQADGSTASLQPEGGSRGKARNPHADAQPGFDAGGPAPAPAPPRAHTQLPTIGAAAPEGGGISPPHPSTQHAPPMLSKAQVAQQAPAGANIQQASAEAAQAGAPITNTHPSEQPVQPHMSAPAPTATATATPVSEHGAKQTVSSAQHPPGQSSGLTTPSLTPQAAADAAAGDSTGGESCAAESGSGSDHCLHHL